MLWKWIGKSSVNLSILQDLPIVPIVDFDNLQQEELTLVKPNTGNLCRLSSYFPSIEKATLAGILKNF